MLATLSAAEFLGLLMLTASTMRGRVHTGDGAFAFGLKRNAKRDVYLVLDALAWLMASLFETEIGVKPAAEVIRICWDAWLRALQVVESVPPDTEIPADYQMFIAVGVSKGKPGRIEVGPKHEVEAKLADFEVRSLNIHRALRQLRANSREAGVPLPEKLTIPFDDPHHAEWRREIDAYRKLGEMRFRDKMKMRKTRAAAAATTFTIGTGP